MGVVELSPDLISLQTIILNFFKEHIIKNRMHFFTFDFSGCGLSEGEYISLGVHESDDLEVVVNYLRNSGKVSQIGLWGRSMGAVTALLYGAKDVK